MQKTFFVLNFERQFSSLETASSEQDVLGENALLDIPRTKSVQNKRDVLREKGYNFQS